jgi:hypothetical protein
VLGWGHLAGDAGLQVLAGSRQRATIEPRRPKGLVSDDRERGIIGSVRSVQHAAKLLEQALHDVGLPATMQPCLPCQRWLHPTSALILKALSNL